MNSITCSRLVFSSIAELGGVCRFAPDNNLNFVHLKPAMQTIEENFSSLINGYNPYTDCFINDVDAKHNSTEGVEYLLLMRQDEFNSLLNQALFTARGLEMAFEESGDLEEASRVSKIRRQLVTAKHGSLDLDPVEG
jgi:hypothetical protein